METEIKSVLSLEKLRKQTVRIQPIKRKGGWVPEGHDSHFMNDGSKMGIVVPTKPKSEVLVDPLADFGEEGRNILFKELGLEDINELNTHRKSNFWKNNTVFLDRNGAVLNLSDIDQLVQFLILRVASNIIAPSWKERFMKGTYKFAIVMENEEVVEKATQVDTMKTAYKLLGRIDTSVDKMVDFLHAYYLRKKDAKRPPANPSIDWLKQEVGNIVENDVSTFIEIMNDQDYDLKVLIRKAEDVGAIVRKKHEFFLPGADKPIGVLSDLIDFLNDDRNNSEKVRIFGLVQKANEK